MRSSKFDNVSGASFNRRIIRASIAVMLVFAVLVLRLWFMQIFNGPEYRDKSEGNRIRLQSIPPFRGMIYDRNGSVLVDNRPAFDLNVIPEEVSDPDKLLESLSSLIPLDVEGARRVLNKGRKSYPFKAVCLRSDLSRDHIAVLETHGFNLPGVLISVRPQREYVHGDFASHVLGYLGEINREELRSGDFSGVRAGDSIGKAGVEMVWQSLLQGIRGGKQVEVDASGRVLRIFSRKQAVPGSAVHLTIDSKLQSVAEQNLRGKMGAAVAMDPHTGAILAMVSSPSFDPNCFASGIKESEWRRISSSSRFPLQNRATSGQYPAASVFKIIMAVAALEEGVIEPAEKIFCNGLFRIGDASFRCWKRRGHGKIDLYHALVESCDVYFYKVGMRLGVDKIADWSRRFGLGSRTGFELGGEKPGLVPTDEWKRDRFGVSWQAGETVSLSIGQSFLLVTPLQVCSMMSTLFNGGILYRPQITKLVGTPEEAIYSFKPEEASRINVSGETLSLVRKALVGAVNDRGGTGRQARLEQTTVAGKTGTAQVVALDRSKLLETEGDIPERFRDHAWFAAAAPAVDPRIVVAVLVEHGGHGGSSAAPIAREMIKTYLKLDS
ncbi:MAG: penicillin-binding protein 2 [Desulfatiglandaceae bacterium]